MKCRGRGRVRGRGEWEAGNWEGVWATRKKMRRRSGEFGGRVCGDRIGQCAYVLPDVEVLMRRLRRGGEASSITGVEVMVVGHGVEACD